MRRAGDSSSGAWCQPDANRRNELSLSAGLSPGSNERGCSRFAGRLAGKDRPRFGYPRQLVRRGRIDEVQVAAPARFPSRGRPIGWIVMNARPAQRERHARPTERPARRVRKLFFSRHWAQCLNGDKTVWFFVKGPGKNKLGKHEKARKRSALAFSFARVVIVSQKTRISQRFLGFNKIAQLIFSRALSTVESAMSMIDVFSSVPREWFIWTLLGFAGGVGLIAVLSPRLFSALSAWSSVWIDTEKSAKSLDRRIDIEQHVLRHSRLYGAMTVVATGVLAAFSMRLEYAGRWVALVSLGFVAANGLLALLSPPLFSRLAHWGSLWIDTDRFFATLDRRIDIDRPVLRYSRLFGMAVLGVVVVLASCMLWTA